MFTLTSHLNVLRRLGLQNEPELEELLRLFAHGFHILFAAKTPTLTVVEKDPDDNKFIECAVALKADFIISGDKALKEIQDYMDIRIQNPKRDLSKTPPFAQFSAVAKAMAGQAVLGSNFNPQNTPCIPVVKIFACLELESRFSGKHFSKVSKQFIDHYSTEPLNL